MQNWVDKDASSHLRNELIKPSFSVRCYSMYMCTQTHLNIHEVYVDWNVPCNSYSSTDTQNYRTSWCMCFSEGCICSFLYKHWLWIHLSKSNGFFSCFASPFAHFITWQHYFLTNDKFLFLKNILQGNLTVVTGLLKLYLYRLRGNTSLHYLQLFMGR